MVVLTGGPDDGKPLRTHAHRGDVRDERRLLLHLCREGLVLVLVARRRRLVDEAPHHLAERRLLQLCLHQIIEGVDGNSHGGANWLEVEGLEPNLLKALGRLGDEIREPVLACELGGRLQEAHPVEVRREDGRVVEPRLDALTLTADSLARVGRERDVLQTGDEAEVPGVVGVKVRACLSSRGSSVSSRRS